MARPTERYKLTREGAIVAEWLRESTIAQRRQGHHIAQAAAAFAVRFCIPTLIAGRAATLLLAAANAIALEEVVLQQVRATMLEITVAEVATNAASKQASHERHEQPYVTLSSSPFLISPIARNWNAGVSGMRKRHTFG
jgi:hypothetical protein